MKTPKPLCKRCNGIIFNKRSHAQFCKECAIITKINANRERGNRNYHLKKKVKQERKL